MSVFRPIRCVSYNCRGWNSGSILVSDLLKSCDICFLQEHWLLHEHLFNLNINSEFLSHGVSGMDSSEILVGRPYGGCAILYKKSLCSNISMVPCNARRFCAVKFTSSSGCIVLFHLCLPPY